MRLLGHSEAVEAGPRPPPEAARSGLDGREHGATVAAGGDLPPAARLAASVTACSPPSRMACRSRRRLGPSTAILDRGCAPSQASGRDAHRRTKNRPTNMRPVAVSTLRDIAPAVSPIAPLAHAGVAERRPWRGSRSMVRDTGRARGRGSPTRPQGRPPRRARWTSRPISVKLPHLDRVRNAARPRCSTRVILCRAGIRCRGTRPSRRHYPS